MPVFAWIAKRCTTRSNVRRARQRCTRQSLAGSSRPSGAHIRALNQRRHHPRAQRSIARSSTLRIAHHGHVVCSKAARSASRRSDCWAGSCARRRRANRNEDRRWSSTSASSTSAVFIFNAGCRIYTRDLRASDWSLRAPMDWRSQFGHLTAHVRIGRRSGGCL
jgi:hypothetical protein